MTNPKRKASGTPIASERKISPVKAVSVSAP
jgi:hypothetical protein